MDEDEEDVYVRLAAMVAAAKRLDPQSPPKELIMSLETVIEQIRKIEELCAKMKTRATAMTGPTARSE
jgi:hypothetical protein